MEPGYWEQVLENSEEIWDLAGEIADWGAQLAGGMYGDEAFCRLHELLAEEVSPLAWEKAFSWRTRFPKRKRLQEVLDAYGQKV